MSAWALGYLFNDAPMFAHVVRIITEPPAVPFFKGEEGRGTPIEFVVMYRRGLGIFEWKKMSTGVVSMVYPFFGKLGLPRR